MKKIKKQNEFSSICQIQGQCHLYRLFGGAMMMTKKDLLEKWDVNSLQNDLIGFNDVYREIADEIGVENAIIIFNLFRGMQVSFPSRLFSREYIHESILREYDGSNVAFLAQKYNYSERNIWRIIKNGKEK